MEKERWRYIGRLRQENVLEVLQRDFCYEQLLVCRTVNLPASPNDLARFNSKKAGVIYAIASKNVPYSGKGPTYSKAFILTQKGLQFCISNMTCDQLQQLFELWIGNFKEAWPL